MIGDGEPVPYVDRDVRTQLARSRVSTSTCMVELFDYGLSTGREDTVTNHDELVLNISLDKATRNAFGRLADRSGDRGVRVGSVIILPPDTPFRMSVGAGAVRTLSCSFSTRSVCEILDGDFLRRLRAAPSFASFNLANARVRQLMLSLTNEIRQCNLGGRFAMESLAILSLIEAARSLGEEGFRHDSGGLATWQLRRIEERLEELGRPPAVAELAEACRVSPRHLMRAFKAATGATLGEHIRAAQTAHAIRLLKHAHAPIAQIAAELGFGSVSSFSTAFSREVGVSPTEFRRRNG